MAHIIMIHGAFGSPDENWFPWLKRQLAKQGHTVIIPQFPTPEGQSLEAWLKVFRSHQDSLTKESVLIGHSLGPAFILRLLERTKQPIYHAFFIAGFIDPLGNETFDSINKTFIEGGFDWQQIRKNSEGFTVINSDNDPYVPLSQGRALARNLGVKLLTLSDAGHINSAAGYTAFPFLLKRVKEILRTNR